MRVISGRFRGRKLGTPDGRQTRPITDRVKETVFNILGSRFGTPGGLPDVAVLDLFAGTGGLGIEAVSRGAAICRFVENDRRTLPILRANLAQFDEPEALVLVVDNAWRMAIPPAHAGYGLVFCDPPYKDSYDTGRLAGLLDRISFALAPDGLIILRCDKHTPTPEPAELRLVDDRIYGDMRVLWWGRAANAAATDDRADLADVDGSPEPEHD